MQRCQEKRTDILSMNFILYTQRSWTISHTHTHSVVLCAAVLCITLNRRFIAPPSSERSVWCVEWNSAAVGGAKIRWWSRAAHTHTHTSTRTQTHGLGQTCNRMFSRKTNEQDKTPKVHPGTYLRPQVCLHRYTHTSRHTNVNSARTHTTH